MHLDERYFLPEALVLGIEEIDHEHAQLFRQMTELKIACIEQNALPRVMGDALIDAVRQHCATESRLAVASGVDFRQHAQKHHEVVSGISRMMARVQDGQADIFGLIRYLQYWFERHIWEEDIPLGRELVRTGGVTAKEKAEI